MGLVLKGDQKFKRQPINCHVGGPLSLETFTYAHTRRTQPSGIADQPSPKWLLVDCGKDGQGPVFAFAAYRCVFLRQSSHILMQIIGAASWLGIRGCLLPVREQHRRSRFPRTQRVTSMSRLKPDFAPDSMRTPPQKRQGA